MPESTQIEPDACAMTADRLAESLRDRRLVLGDSQQHVAERCGMPRSRVSAVESSIARTRIGTVLGIARQLRVSLSLLPSSGCGTRPRAGITSITVLGRAIRATRRQLGWHQADLAKRCGLNRTQISRIETGVVNPRTDSVLRITNAMGLDLEIDDDERAFLLEDVLAELSGPGR